MLNNIADGNFYIKNRKNMEKKFNGLDTIKGKAGIEGFNVISRSDQLKNPNNYNIPDGLDPGQSVMCKQDMVRYIRLSSTNTKTTPLSIQHIDVYDENGNNVSGTSNKNYINQYQITKGQCKVPVPVTPDNGKLVGNKHGPQTSNDCESICNDNLNCTGYTLQNESTTEGLNQCFTYEQPNITGDGDNNYICRIKQRKSGTPSASSNGLASLALNAYWPLADKPLPWPSSYASTFGTDQPAEWELDLGREINVKKITIYIDPIIKTILGKQLTSIQLDVMDKYRNTLMTKTLDGTLKRQTVDIHISISSCGGPVIEKNIDDFDELKDIQIQYNRELQEYNKAIQNLIDNTKLYIGASNKSNNRYHNMWLKDSETGSVGYVTNKGVWKWMPPGIGDSIQGKNGCPANWNQALNVKRDEGEEYSIDSAPYNEMVKTGGVPLIKGEPMITNQSCGNAGNNLYIIEPNQTSDLKYVGCNQSPGEYQSDLGNTTIDSCKQRAADLGYNVFQLGQNTSSSQAPCYIGGSTNNDNGSNCPYVNGIGNVGQNIPSKYVKSKYWWRRGYWTSPISTYATYTTSGADNQSLGTTYHITDDLKKVIYPNNMVSIEGTDFHFVGNYDSIGNDISSGSGLSIEQVKQKCIDTPGAAGFVMNNGNYYIKNRNMWPRGKRQLNPNVQLYVRNTSVINNNSCSNIVDFSTQQNINGYLNSGETMSESRQCSLGLISQRDTAYINTQYQKLNNILNTMRTKIEALTKTDVNLNKKLLKEYRVLKDNLQKYENTYREIKRANDASNGIYATLEEDSKLQMLSYNSKYILWTILALAVTIVTMKIIKQ